MSPTGPSQLQTWKCGHPWSSPCRRGRGCGSGSQYQHYDSVGQTGKEGVLLVFTLSPGESRGLDPCGGRADGIRGNSWPEPVPCGRELAFPCLREGAAPHSPVTFQVGHFPEHRCLLMSWGGRLSALYPSSGPHITSAPRGWPRASRLWLQARALCQPGLSGQLAYHCQPGASP